MTNKERVRECCRLVNELQDEARDEVWFNGNYHIPEETIDDIVFGLTSILVDENPELMSQLLSGVRYTLTAKLEEYKDDPQGFIDWVADFNGK